MLKIGITGGIGSGKTTVCRLFGAFGIPVYDADSRAKQLMVTDADLIREIVALFGPAAYHTDGSLHRQYIAQRVFERPEELARLNAIVHPAVLRDGEAWHRRQHNVPYTVKEAALLFESGSAAAMDVVITVFAPRQLRIARVRARDGVDEASVRARMNKQMEEGRKLELANYVICNDQKSPLIRQVFDIHHQLLRT